MKLHHVNVPIPPGRVEPVVAFYELLGLVRVPKTGNPGGAWLEFPDGAQVHLSERDGSPHPDQHFAVHVTDLAGLVARLTEAGHPWRADPAAPRGWTADPAGNAVELVLDPRNGHG